MLFCLSWESAAKTCISQTTVKVSSWVHFLSTILNILKILNIWVHFFLKHLKILISYLWFIFWYYQPIFCEIIMFQLYLNLQQTPGRVKEVVPRKLLLLIFWPQDHVSITINRFYIEGKHDFFTRKKIAKLSFAEEKTNLETNFGAPRLFEFPVECPNIFFSFTSTWEQKVIVNIWAKLHFLNPKERTGHRRFMC